MAEGLLRALGGETWRVFSAGTEATTVRQEAIAVMAEVGIDISQHASKSLDQFLGEQFDAVVTVCDDANESCPIFPGALQRLHWSVADPSTVRGSERERLIAFRTARGDLRARIESTFTDLDSRKLP
jgi:arsenate reductase